MDESRRPQQWLVESLRNYPPARRSLELYARELARFPHEGIDPSCLSLLSRPGSALDRQKLLRSRWDCAFALERWGIVAGDLEALRPRLKAESEIEWVQLLRLALGYLAWAEEPEISQAFCQYRDEAEQCSIGLPAVFDILREIDMLDPIRVQCATLLRSKDEVFLPIVSLVAKSWVKPFEALRPELLRTLAPLGLSPQKALRDMTRMRQEAPAVVLWLISSLDRLPESRVDGNRRVTITDMRRFLNDRDFFDARGNDELVLRYCLDTWLAIEDFVALARQALRPEDRSLIPVQIRLIQLENDSGLQAALTICRVFAA